jgi:transmembrane 9 superfamily protein 2/4
LETFILFSFFYLRSIIPPHVDHFRMCINFCHIPYAMLVSYPFKIPSENYKWWWRSFLVGGSSGIYLFLFSVFYFQEMKITRLSTTIMFFSYMGILSSILSLITGTIGFLSSLWFVRHIYSIIKSD